MIFEINMIQYLKRIQAHECIPEWYISIFWVYCNSVGPLTTNDHVNLLKAYGIHHKRYFGIIDFSTSNQSWHLAIGNLQHLNLQKNKKLVMHFPGQVSNQIHTYFHICNQFDQNVLYYLIS